jgi:polysaccharide export outer membrane protein
MVTTWKTGGPVAALLLSLALGLAGGCSVKHGEKNRVSRESVPAEVATLDLTSAKDRARLEALVAVRSKLRLEDGYRLGPDDLLDIRIPDLLQASQGVAEPRTVPGSSDIPVVAGAPAFQQGLRVSATGEVSLPTLGTIKVTGLTPPGLEREIARRLVAGGILRAPQVNVLVAEYRSHVVAVIGSVERPGLYPVTRPGATLADLVWAAGGPNKESGRMIEFTPGGEASSDRSPLVLDLQALLRQAPEGSGLPNPTVLPGDVINLPVAGSVLVDGWVQKPGAYPISRGLTVSGAVAAAGGHSFPADQRRAEVRRVLADGQDLSFNVDLEAVAKGLAPDVPVTDGDVIRLPTSYARVLPWGMWMLAKEIVHVGGSVALF